MVDPLPFIIVPLDETLRPQALDLIAREWGGLTMVARGQVVNMRELPGMAALRRDDLGGDLIGLATYRLEDAQCEVMSLNSWAERTGIGSALLGTVEAAARAAGCTRIRLITTNDNLHALGFYQRRGYRLVALYTNALERSRQLKPTIPLTGMHGIPLCDEIELAKDL